MLTLLLDLLLFRPDSQVTTSNSNHMKERQIANGTFSSLRIVFNGEIAEREIRAYNLNNTLHKYHASVKQNRKVNDQGVKGIRFEWSDEGLATVLCSSDTKKEEILPEIERHGFKVVPEVSSTCDTIVQQVSGDTFRAHNRAMAMMQS